MTISQTIRSIILNNLADIYNNIILHQNYCIIKVVYRDDENCFIKRAVLANMLRSSGFGFVSTRGLSRFPHESDHEDCCESFIIPHLPHDVAIKICKVFGNLAFIYHKESAAQLQQSYLTDTKEISFPISFVCEEIDNKHVEQVMVPAELFDKNIRRKYQYDYNQADAEYLEHLLEIHRNVFISPNTQDIYTSYHPQDFCFGDCFFAFSKYIKYMPAMAFIKRDDFASIGIAGALDAYWPLT